MFFTALFIVEKAANRGTSKQVRYTHINPYNISTKIYKKSRYATELRMT